MKSTTHNSMRPVTFSPQYTNTVMDGYFHGWGKGIWMYGSVPHTVTVGIIECADGQIMIAEPDKIKFTTPINKAIGVAPCDLIKEHMAINSMTSLVMSRHMGISLGDIEQLLAGDIEIRAHIADKLALAFPNTDRSYWLSKEKEYQENKDKNIGVSLL